jgi:hypothetical protein
MGMGKEAVKFQTAVASGEVGGGGMEMWRWRGVRPVGRRGSCEAVLEPHVQRLALHPSPTAGGAAAASS